MMDQLKSKPNPKRWWECIKLLAGKALKGGGNALNYSQEKP
jgi:hypothetical protein